MRYVVLAGVLAAFLGATAAEAAPRVLFIGNSFTFGATSAVRHYRADAVHDLNGENTGGVPALFRLMSEEAGLHYDVSLETIPGATLERHWTERRSKIAKRWDVVVLQSYSTLDAHEPGNPTRLIAAAKEIGEALKQKNRSVALYLTATWARADLIYDRVSPWYGAPLEKMTADLRAGYEAAKEAVPGATVLPVGEAWLRAFVDGVADDNPYDGIAYNKIDLWGWDHYHASTYGYYLEALVAFGAITGRDPRTLGPHEKCADELGISPDQAVALQQVASQTLAAAPVTAALRPDYPAAAAQGGASHGR